ncbi:MAG: MFS transporter [Candidatus Hodarchaeota archaeon]
MEQEYLMKSLKKEYHILQVLCFITWCANVIFMIFGGIFINKMGVSLSGIFLLNLITIIVSFFMSTLLNRMSDKMKKRKKFMLLAYFLRTIGILLLSISTNIFIFITYYVLISLLNPLSFDVAIIYEIGEKLEFLQFKIAEKPERKNAATSFYLKYRMFGSLGWALMAPVAGFGITILNQLFPSLGILFPNLVGYRLFIFMGFIFYLVTLIVFYLAYDENLNSQVDKIMIPKQVQINGELGNTKPLNDDTRSKRTSLGYTFILLLVTIFLFHCGTTLFQTPYKLFLNDFSKGKLELVGISYFCSAILEVPLFYLAYYLINRRGYKFTLSLSFILELTRIALTIAVIPLNIATLVVPLQFMNSFSLRWPSLTHGVSHELSRENKATGMNLNLVIQKTGTLSGDLIGALISSSISGILVYQSLFLGSFLFISLNTIIYIFGNIILQRKKKLGRNDVD